MPYAPLPDPEEYFERYQTLKPLSYWQAQQEQNLREGLGEELYSAVAEWEKLI